MLIAEATSATLLSALTLTAVPLSANETEVPSTSKSISKSNVVDAFAVTPVCSEIALIAAALAFDF